MQDESTDSSEHDLALTDADTLREKLPTSPDDFIRNPWPVIKLPTARTP
jgi:hypothetical protein